MVSKIGILGVPTSMGAFAPGQEGAPAALRAAGLAERLGDAGVAVEDLGDLPRRRWTPDPDHPTAQNAGAVAEITALVARHVAAAFDPDRVLLVLGGDCSIELGVVAGHTGRLGLLYTDLHADLNTPHTTDQGALDWMVVSHLIGAEGTDTAALLEPDQIRYVGLDLNRMTPGERDLLAEHEIAATSVQRLARDPLGAARHAREQFESADHLLVHLDVDLVDFNDAPLSENTGRGQGLPLDTVMTALGELVRAPNLRALTVTELNPQHGAEDGSTIARFVDGLATALAA